MQIEIKRFLESVYGLKVESVHTLNYEGKKKRRKTGTFRESDFKKVSTCCITQSPVHPSLTWTTKRGRILQSILGASWRFML